MAIAPFDAEQAHAHQEAWAKFLSTDVTITNSIGMKLTLIPPGQGILGGGDSSEGAISISISRPLFVGAYEVTNLQWKKVMGEVPSEWKGGNRPVETVSWLDAKEFCRKLSELPEEKAAHRVYRLPTDAEWEYACRAGTTTNYSFGDDVSIVHQFEWVRSDPKKPGKPQIPETHNVGLKKPNQFRLYDTGGNVSEWCDGGDRDYSNECVKGTLVDPRGPTGPGIVKFERGGSVQGIDVAPHRRNGFGKEDGSATHCFIGFRIVFDVARPSAGYRSASSVIPETNDDVPDTPDGAPPLAVVPFSARQACSHQEAWARFLGTSITITNSIGIKLTVIPAGKFTMDFGARKSEVTLTRPLFMATHEATNAQWRKVMGDAPSFWQEDDHPVETVSWLDATEFCRKLSELPAEKAAHRVYRLPTDAEWEYACRAGTTTTYFFGDDHELIDDYGWVKGNSYNQSHAIGLKKPNAWGLFDMHGNVAEWCQDWWTEGSSEPAPKARGLFSGWSIVRRGGGWSSFPKRFATSSCRFGCGPTTKMNMLGFRVVVECR